MNDTFFMNSNIKESDAKYLSLSNLRIINTILFVVNIILAYFVGESVVAGSVPYVAGITYSIIRALIIPFIVVLFFQLGRMFRTKKHRHYIFLAVSILILLSVSSGFSVIANL